MTLTNTQETQHTDMHSVGHTAPRAARLQHCSQTPLSESGRQCHIQPDRSCAAPMFEVVSSWECVPLPEPEPDEPVRFVCVFVASFSKVVMMSVAKQTHGSCESRYSAWVAHSAHATDFVSSGFPAPIGAATTIETTRAAAARRSMVGELGRFSVRAESCTF